LTNLHGTNYTTFRKRSWYNPTIDLKFDLVFIDADKENYLTYWELIVPKMNKGGIILSDNVLWSGKVLEPLQKTMSAPSFIRIQCVT
jgi:predicted O-methyltransferase YrrM